MIDRVPETIHDSGKPAGIINDELPLSKYSSLFHNMEHHYRCLVGTLPGIVYILDEKGHFTFLSDSIESLGYTRDDLLGRHFSQIIDPGYIHSISREDVLPLYSGITTGPEKAPKLFDERRSFPRRTTDLKVPFIRKRRSKDEDEKVLYCKVHASGQYAGDPEQNKQRFCGTLGVITNEAITARMPEAELRDRQISLPFLKSLSHDFNNILTAICGYVQLLEIMTKSKQTTEAFATIKECLERATELVRKLNMVAQVTRS